MISIGEAAFSSCSALASVSLPSTVKSIAATSFTYCIKLSYVSVSSSNPNYKYSNGLIVADAQLGGVSDIVADTPDGTVTLYRLDGVKVYEGPRDGMGTLPSGIYVVNGRKVIL